MKRSTQVTLALMGAVGIGGMAYAFSPSCPQPPPQQPQNGVAANQSCRSSYSGGHSGWHFYSPSSGGTTTTTISAPSGGTATASRGGFGALGRAFASIGS